MDLHKKEDRLVIIKKALRHALGDGDISSTNCEGALNTVLFQYVYDMYSNTDGEIANDLMDPYIQGKLFNEYESALLDILEIIRTYKG